MQSDQWEIAFYIMMGEGTISLVMKDQVVYYLFNTQTVYLPLEWSVCQTREYHFNMSIKGEAIGYEILKTTIEAMVNSHGNFTMELGYDNTQDLLIQWMIFIWNLVDLLIQ